MKQATLSKLQLIDTIKVRKAFASINFSSRDKQHLFEHCAAYIITKCGGNPPDSLDAFIAEYDIKEDLASVLDTEIRPHWDMITDLSHECSTDEFAAFLLFENTRMDDPTPDYISKLAIKLLKPQKKKSCAELCAGSINFIRECILEGIETSFFANEVNAMVRAIAMMRADILDCGIEVSQADTFELNNTYDRVFCHPPFGRELRSTTGKGDAFSPYWLYAKRCIKLLSDKGRAVCIMADSTTRNLSDISMRREFIDNGLIEAVISLPGKILEQTGIAISIMVMSRGNKSVSFVDATDIYTSGRRNKTLSDADIDCILEHLGSAKRVPLDDIKASNYDLSPVSYVDKPDISEDSVTLESLIKRVTRGSQLPSADLDKLVCTEPTDIRLLMLSDMNTGVISDDLSYLSELAPRLNKYCAKDSDLIITKNGLPVKTAVVSLQDDTTLLVNGNLYIVELDTAKVLPYYVKAYLDSKPGQAQLKNGCKGEVVPNLPLESLKNFMIPLKSLEEQKRIASRYIETQKKLMAMRKKVTELEEELTEFF